MKLEKIGWLVLGAVLGLFGGSLLSKKVSAEQTETAINLQKQLFERRLNEVTGERDSCTAKFQRSTILYDGVLNVDRGWLIPADVEPKLIGNRPNASYTHYDPKTQTETVRLNAQHQ